MNLPDGTPVPQSERTYTNACTIKVRYRWHLGYNKVPYFGLLFFGFHQHGSFGGPGLDKDIMYTAGSDDFRGYVWKVPPVAELIEKRREIGAREWSAGGVGSNTIGTTIWRACLLSQLTGCNRVCPRSLGNTIPPREFANATMPVDRCIFWGLTRSTLIESKPRA